MFTCITSAVLVVIRGFRGEDTVHPITGYKGPDGD